MIAVSMNVGGGVRKTVYVHTKQKHYKHEDGHMAPDVRGHGSVPLSHSRNVVMRTVLQHLILVFL